MNKGKSFDTRKLVLLALLTAIVILLQFLGASIKFGTFSISLILMPLAIGAALIGTYAGVWLGLVFGLVVLLSGDAAPFLAVNPAGTIATVLLKGALAGFAAGAAYKLIAKKNRTVAAIVAAVVCPIVNTGIFVIGSYIFFVPTLTEWAAGAEAAVGAAAAGFADATEWIVSQGFDTFTQWAASAGKNINVAAFIFIGMIGLNFLLELGLNLILSPTIVRLVQYGQDRRKK